MTTKLKKSGELENPRVVLTLPGSGVGVAFRKIVVPSAGLRMGSRGVYYDEEPVHRVSISQDYWMAETPVTQEQFAVWTSAAGLKHENSFKNHPEHPAEALSWDEANQFCAWLTEHCRGQFPSSNLMACLPTEAEWEYACRGCTDTEYYTGDGEVALAEAGWYVGNSGNTTKPVGLLAANEFGLYDMHGNVFEWCHDEWNSNAYRDPVDGDADPEYSIRNDYWKRVLAKGFPENDRSRERVVRGGSGVVTAYGCRSACRYWLWFDGRDWGIGFRVCLVPGPSASKSKSFPTDKQDAAPPRPKPEAKGGGEGGLAPPGIDLSRVALPRRAKRGRKNSKI